ncbi:MAG TPA: DUF5990 family protein [Gemmatimonadaceae bacterium]|nr:DUF5990 family protein [Gemmatimonadaceae bacterium]
MKRGEVEIPLRITLYRIPPGVKFALQKGKSGAAHKEELFPPTRIDPTSISFDFAVRVAPDRLGTTLRFLGEFTQGPADKRFVYLNSGRAAGQPDTPWNRRAKIPLTTITPALIDHVRETPNTVLLIEINGRAADGGPVVASQLSSTEWRLVPK